MIRIPKEKITAAVAEWDKAEEYIKLAEQIEANVETVAVAELRYAGRRLVDAINEYGNTGEDGDFGLFIDETRAFCLRAQHDALDSIFLFLRKRLFLIENEFGREIISQYSAQYVELWEQIYEADEYVAASRGDRLKRPELYDQMADELIPRMIKTYRALKSSEELMVVENNRLAAIEVTQERSQKREKVLYVIAIVSLIVAIGSLIFAAWPYFADNPEDVAAEQGAETATEDQ